jgi:hypothetical protein
MIARLCVIVSLSAMTGCAAAPMLATSAFPGIAQASALPGNAACGMLARYGVATCQQGSIAGNQAGQATPDHAQLQTLLAQKTTCTAAVRNQPEYARIAGHFSDVASGNFSMVQLSDDTRPTPAEARLVAKYYDTSLPCIQTFSASVSKLAPSQGLILDQSIAAQQVVVAQLASRRISWGDYAQQSQKISQQAATKLQVAGL